MIEINVSTEIVKQATDKAQEMGKLNNSILKGDGNLTGFIGEFIANSILKGTICNTYDYDLKLADGTKIDVKTKKTKLAPKDYYECSVAAFNTNQKCDYYCFVRVKDDYSKAWYLGVYSKADYYKDAKFLKKGDFDPDNEYTVKADCYNIKISDLLPEIVQHDKDRS